MVSKKLNELNSKEFVEVVKFVSNDASALDLIYSDAKSDFRENLKYINHDPNFNIEYAATENGKMYLGGFQYVGNLELAINDIFSISIVNILKYLDSNWERISMNDIKFSLDYNIAITTENEISDIEHSEEYTATIKKLYTECNKLYKEFYKLVKEIYESTLGAADPTSKKFKNRVINTFDDGSEFIFDENGECVDFHY